MNILFPVTVISTVPDINDDDDSDVDVVTLMI